MVAVVILALFAALPDPTEKWPADARKELKALQGRWTVEKVVVAGVEQTPGEERVFEVKGRFIVADGAAGAEFVALDPQTAPKCVDFRDFDTDRADPVMEGAYKLDGDTLTFCVYTGEGKSRPTDFDGKGESTVVMVWKRVKK